MVHPDLVVTVEDPSGQPIPGAAVLLVRERAPSQVNPLWSQRDTVQPGRAPPAPVPVLEPLP